MYTLLGCKTTVLFLSLLQGDFSDQFRQLPTPEALGREITRQLAANYRKVLATTIELRKRYEQTPETRAAEIAKLKECEADLRKRIERLEKGILAPPPIMPIVPAERAKPKPSERD